MTEQDGQPLEQVQVDAAAGRVMATFERSLYPLDAIYGAAYSFIDRCFVFLDAPDETHVSVELRGREKLDAAALEALMGELANELVSQAWRNEITEKNRLTIETVTMHALAGAAGVPRAEELEDLDDMDFSDDVFDDPLGIATPWEDKFGTKEGAAAAAADAPQGESTEPTEPPVSTEGFDDPVGVSEPWQGDADAKAEKR